jgi:hypothetical protein
MLISHSFVQVGPVAKWQGNKVQLKYHIGVRGNGVDKPVWPKDLTVEIVN